MSRSSTPASHSRMTSRLDSGSFRSLRASRSGTALPRESRKPPGSCVVSATMSHSTSTAARRQHFSPQRAVPNTGLEEGRQGIETLNGVAHGVARRRRRRFLVLRQAGARRSWLEIDPWYPLRTFFHSCAWSARYTSLSQGRDTGRKCDQHKPNRKNPPHEARPPSLQNCRACPVWSLPCRRRAASPFLRSRWRIAPRISRCCGSRRVSGEK